MINKSKLHGLVLPVASEVSLTFGQQQQQLLLQQQQSRVAYGGWRKKPSGPSLS